MTPGALSIQTTRLGRARLLSVLAYSAIGNGLAGALRCEGRASNMIEVRRYE